ncbi:MAG: ABC transporter ATP-binding protein [Phycisphaerales bacterium]|nr:ABC transporter ATP-binding protein [Phycisphaerales bacterium]
MTPLLDIENLELAVRGDPVVHGVSACVQAGEITAVVGESGSGKTLTALAAIGLLPPAIEMTGGDIRIEGESCTGFTSSQWRAMRGRRVAMVFQEPMTALDPVFTVDELLREVLALDGITGRTARERSMALLEEVRIPDPARCLRSAPHQLSGGMRQRVVIALALARSPSLLLADEPTTALDALTQEAVLDLFDDLRRSRGLGILLITHDLGLVAHRVQRLVVLHAGRTCESGSARSVLENPRHPYTRGLFSCRLPVDHRQADLARLEDLLADPGAWDPQPSEEGPVRPWWPSEEGQDAASPRLVSVGPDHLLAV